MQLNKNGILKFWAKTSKDSTQSNAFHPLICHLIDVAVVTKKIWDKVLPIATKERIAKDFGETDLEKVGLLIAFIAGLHDLGKCSPPFQLRGHNEKGRQTEKLLELYKDSDFWQKSVSPAKEAPHGYVTTIELPDILECYGVNKKIAEQISVLIGGHHGVFPNSEWRKNGLKAVKSNLGNPSWAEARRELTKELARLLDIKPLKQSENLKLDNGTIMIIAGLVSVADWIGSDTQFFKCKINDFESDFELNLADYLENAKKQAETALETLGWLNWTEYKVKKNFDELFPFEPRGLQTQAIEIAKELTKQGIVVIESPMGEGKTEAAMFLADWFNSKLNQRGIYFALPTQATSNQMFERVKNFLLERFNKVDKELINLQLLHGHASLSAEFKTLKDNFQNIQGISDDECKDGNCVPQVVAAEWFTHRKKGLLAPFGVGTIDQALMAVLQTKHVFVRLFGLAHKTVIIDEVHAYDAYMSALLERLLEWLAALGSPVILLSATLPIERRNKLIEAYQKGLGVETTEIQTADYPRISYATDSIIKVKHIESSAKEQTLHIEKVDENFIEKLRTKLEKDEGCVAIICNTVGRSQAIYEKLSNDDFFKDKIDLLHSRFRFCDRDEIERRVLKNFGKSKDKSASKRPKRAVLIATQIIEQSLDIDFDLMISDLAPIDLLLQRAGRLHRHNRPRNKEFEKPTLWIIEPKVEENGIPNFENSSVYDSHILLRTWLILNNLAEIKIPNEIEQLIEAVYGENHYQGENPELKKFWDKSLKKYKENQSDDDEEAAIRWIAMPHTPITPSELYKLVGSEKEQLAEENSLEFYKNFQALTRLHANNLSVVCLYQKGKKVFLDKEFKNEIDYKNVISHKNLSKVETKIVNENIKRILGNSLPISRNHLIITIMDSKKTEIAEWKKSPLLRSCRVLWLNEDSTAEIGDYFLYLHPKLGLRVKYFKNQEEE